MIKESLLALSLIGGSNYADYKTTQDALKRGGVEINPVFKVVPLAPTKIVATAVETGVFVYLYKNKKKKAAWIWVGSIVVVNTAVAIHNSRVNPQTPQLARGSNSLP
jgi:hypothetical protein